MLITELDLAIDVGRHLDAVGARWCIGGSVASSLLGVPRATLDVDCAKDDELSRAELARRIMLDVGGRTVTVCSPEDIILQKLLWFVEAGGSERQWGDALGVVQTRRDELDLQYLEAHASSHGVAELLARLLAA